MSSRGALPRMLVAARLIALASLNSGCGAGTDRITPTGSPATPTEETTMSFTLTSDAFTEGQTIPSKFTCDGVNVSVPLAWTGAPPEARSFALIADDPDARGFVHWVAFNLPGGETGALAEGASTGSGAPSQGRNDFGDVGWGGPCPPSGSHRYRFELLALDTPLELSGSPTAADVRAASEGHVLARAELVGEYRRGG